eukprot:1142989-Rhodomonas_salina.1
MKSLSTPTRSDCASTALLWGHAHPMGQKERGGAGRYPGSWCSRQRAGTRSAHSRSRDRTRTPSRVPAACQQRHALVRSEQQRLSDQNRDVYRNYGLSDQNRRVYGKGRRALRVKAKVPQPPGDADGVHELLQPPDPPTAPPRQH